MNEKSHNWRNPIIAIAFLAIVAVAGYFYATRERVADQSLTSTRASDQVSSVNGDLLTTLGKLKKLKLDKSIFEDTVWQSLRDFGQTLSPEPKGRSNPFAPLSSQ